MNDRALKPLFVLDALATGALVGSALAALTGAGGEDPMMRLYGLAAGAFIGCFGFGVTASLLSVKLSDDQVRIGIRVLVGLFVATWLGSWLVSTLAGG